jgi:hypothetical protein
MAIVLAEHDQFKHALRRSTSWKTGDAVAYSKRLSFDGKYTNTFPCRRQLTLKNSNEFQFMN